MSEEELEHIDKLLDKWDYGTGREITDDIISILNAIMCILLQMRSD
jgi:hypothetical protein